MWLAAKGLISLVPRFPFKLVGMSLDIVWPRLRSLRALTRNQVVIDGSKITSRTGDVLFGF